MTMSLPQNYGDACKFVEVMQRIFLSLFSVYPVTLNITTLPHAICIVQVRLNSSRHDTV